jgi:hypothetical protein
MLKNQRFLSSLQKEISDRYRKEAPNMNVSESIADYAKRYNEWFFLKELEAFPYIDEKSIDYLKEKDGLYFHNVINEIINNANENKEEGRYFNKKILHNKFKHSQSSIASIIRIFQRRT